VDQGQGERLHVVIDGDDILTNSDAVAAAVKANRKKYMAKQESQNTPGVMECWDPQNSVLLPPGEAMVVGFDTVTKWYEGQLKTTVLALSVQYEEIMGGSVDADEPGNWAFARASYEGTISIDKDDGTTLVVKDAGKILESHARGDDGLWRFTTHMWSSDIAKNTNVQQPDVSGASSSSESSSGLKAVRTMILHAH
jgi:hypothetical protein